MNRQSRLGKLERVIDSELEARARRLLRLDGVSWPELAREYKNISQRHEAIRKRCPQSVQHPTSLAEMEPEVKMLAEEVGLDFEELMAEARDITNRSELDPQAWRWLSSRLDYAGQKYCWMPVSDDLTANRTL